MQTTLHLHQIQTRHIPDWQHVRNACHQHAGVKYEWYEKSRFLTNILLSVVNDTHKIAMGCWQAPTILPLLIVTRHMFGPIPWGHSGPLCHALSLSSSLWTSMRRRRATVHWRHLVNSREAARCGEWAQHFSNASCFTNGMENVSSLCYCGHQSVVWVITNEIFKHCMPLYLINRWVFLSEFSSVISPCWLDEKNLKDNLYHLFPKFSFGREKVPKESQDEILLIQIH